jgi:predicted acetylornithine/succinylornithine family transaminase
MEGRVFMSNEEIISQGLKCVMNTYGRQPIALVKGEGSRVFDADGKEYLDMVGGIAVNALGHAHPEIVAALCEQAAKLIHCSNLYWIEPQVKLASLLTENSCFDKVFFCNSGAEANEGAIKTARKYAKVAGKKNCYKVISAVNSFHGRTFATMAATGQEKIRHNFEPVNPGYKYAAYNDLAAAAALVNENTCAILIEPLQGEGGVIRAENEYLRGLRRLCDENDMLLIFDEVQCGMGRTGRLFAYEHSDVMPDIATVAKALGGGTAIGAFLVNERADVLRPGEHGSTFGGNALAAAAGLAALRCLLKEGFLAAAAAKGDYIVSRLRKMALRLPCIKEIRGLGMLIGVEIDQDGNTLVDACRDKGLLINCTAKNVIRLMPALNISFDEIDKGLAVLEQAMEETLVKTLICD